MFQIGQAVVHPGYGPGNVIGIQELSLSKSNKQYYKIRLLDEVEMTVWVPVQDAEEQGVRCPIRARHYPRTIQHCASRFREPRHVGKAQLPDYNLRD